MDDDFSELEAELKSLRPRALSAAWEARVAVALAESATSAARRAPRRFTSATTWKSWKWATWSAAASLTLVVSAVVVWRGERFFPREDVAGGAEPIATTARYKPVTAEQVLYDSRVEGLVTLADGTTGRQVRDRYVDTITWKNPVTRASLTWSVPRDEIRVVPVMFN